MPDIKLIKLRLDTGYVNAYHEGEFELDVEGLSEKEIEDIIQEELEIMINNEIETSYEIVNMN